MIDILFILENANLRGGTEILTFNLMYALRGAGQDVYILSIIPYAGSEPHVLSFTDKKFRKWSGLNGMLWNKLTFYIVSDHCLCSILRKTVSELQPRLLVNQTYDIITALPTEGRVAQVFNWSVCGYEKSVRSIIGRKGFWGRQFSGFCNLGVTIRRHRKLSKVSRLVVLTHVAANELKSLNSTICDGQIAVIFDPLTVSEDSKTVSSLTNRNIVFVGRLSHEKGVMRLLRIWERVSARLPEYTLSIYGEGDVRDTMEKYIHEHLLQRVVFMGFSKDLEGIYTHADLLCMTSDTEGFGMVLIEAMYYGVPCISFDCPVSPKEIIANAGVIIPCYDETAYVDAVVSLLKDDSRLHALQQKSISRARDFYMNKIIKEWDKLLNND